MDLLLSVPLDPTQYGWAGQLLALVAMLATLVLALRWWFANRRR